MTICPCSLHFSEDPIFDLKPAVGLACHALIVGHDENSGLLLGCSLAEQRDYFWRVRILKPEVGPWSDTFKFTIVAPEKRFAIAKGRNSATVLETLRKAAAGSSREAVRAGR